MDWIIQSIKDGNMKALEGITHHQIFAALLWQFKAMMEEHEIRGLALAEAEEEIASAVLHNRQQQEASE